MNRFAFRVTVCLLSIFIGIVLFTSCSNGYTDCNNPENEVTTPPQTDDTSSANDIRDLTDIELDKLILMLKERQENADKIQNYTIALEKYREEKNKITECEERLELAEYNLSVAYEIIENNPEYNKDPSYLQGHIDLVEQRKQELIAEQGKLKNFEQPVNKCVEGMAWEDVITALERGNATNQSILDILNTNYELHLGDTIPAWYESILRTIRISTGIDITKTTL